MIFLFVCWLPGPDRGGGRRRRVARRLAGLRRADAAAAAAIAAAAGVLSGGRGDPAARRPRGRARRCGPPRVATSSATCWPPASARSGSPRIIVWLARSAPRSQCAGGAAGAAAGVGGGHGLALPGPRPAPRPLAVPLAAARLPAGARGPSRACSRPVALLLPADVLHVLVDVGVAGRHRGARAGLRAATARLEQADRSASSVAVIGRFSSGSRASRSPCSWSPAPARRSSQVASFVGAVDTAFGRAVLYKVLLFGVLRRVRFVNR